MLIHPTEQYTYNEYEELTKQIEDLMWMLMPMPIDDIVKTDMYSESSYIYITPEAPVFKTAKQRFFSRMDRYNTLDYFDHLRNNSQILFNVKLDYQSVDDSAELLCDWFKYQFGDPWKDVLTTCYKVN